MVSEMSGCLDFSQDTKTRTWGELIASQAALKLWPERHRTGRQSCQEHIPTLTSALKADLNFLAAMSLSFTKLSVSFFVYCICIFWLYHTLDNKFPMNHTFWVKWNFFSFALHSWWGHKESDMTYGPNYTPFFGFQIELWILAVEYLVNKVTYTSCDKCRSHSSLSLWIHRLIHISFILIWLSCPVCVRLFILPSHNHTYFLLTIMAAFLYTSLGSLNAFSGVHLCSIV